MKRRSLLVSSLGLPVVVIGPLAVRHATAHPAHPVMRPQPAGEYERGDEDCPPPGMSAVPAEVWCGTRAQCTSHEGYRCRLFQRKGETRTFVYVAEAETHVPREPGSGYVCWCTKKKAP